MSKHPMIEKLGLQAFGPECALPTTEWVVDARDLEKLLSQAKVVYQVVNSAGIESFVYPKMISATHTALLLNIRSLHCKHPKPQITVHSSSDGWNFKCHECNIELEPIWQAKEK